MANPIHPVTPKEDHVVSAWDLLTSHTNNDDHLASERLIRLNSLYSKDAPRDHFTPSSTSAKTPSATDAKNPEQATDSMDTSPIESTDSEKAVKGSDSESQTDGRVMFQEATVKGLAGHILNDSSDELYRRGEEVEAIINSTDRAFSEYFGSHFDGETSNDIEFCSLVASNREEAVAMLKGLERAHGAVQIAL